MREWGVALGVVTYGGTYLYGRTTQRHELAEREQSHAAGAQSILPGADDEGQPYANRP